MPFIHEEAPPPPPCRCVKPARYIEAPDGLLDPTYGDGTIWQCDNCGKYWVLTYKALGLYTWEPVRWWNFTARERIKENR